MNNNNNNTHTPSSLKSVKGEQFLILSFHPYNNNNSLNETLAKNYKNRAVLSAPLVGNNIVFHFWNEFFYDKKYHLLVRVNILIIRRPSNLGTHLKK